MKIFKIEVNERDYFKKVVLVLNSMLGLRPMAIRVLGELLYWNNKYKVMPRDKRYNLIFSYNAKIKMSDHLGITMANFHNQLMYLRKKNILDGNSIKKEFDLSHNNTKDILFSFKVKKDEEERRT